MHTNKPSDKEIYYHPNPEENEQAFRKVISKLYISISTPSLT